MHKSAQSNANKFLIKYVPDFKIKNLKILEVGSKNLNGTLRSVLNNAKCSYVGIDTSGGKDVDIVLLDPYKYPAVDNSFDIVWSSSCFEHNEMFWLSFNEMVRVCKSGGYIYICAPFKEGVHLEPVDCWRFLPDGYKALSKWNKQAKFQEAYIDSRPHNDCVGIFQVIK
jgi:SAM-dependent methyltransferase